MNDETLLKKLRAAFASEAEERLQSLSSGLVTLENTGDAGEQEKILEIIFREAHSLKGAARAVNLSDIETLCQSIESVFSVLKKKMLAPGPELFDVLHQSILVIEKLMTDPGGKDLKIPGQLPGLIQSLAEFKAGKTIERRKKRKDRREKKEDRRSPVPDPEPEVQVNTVNTVFPKLSETVRLSARKLDTVLRKTEELISIKLFLNRQYSDLTDLNFRFEQWKKDMAGAGEIIAALRSRGKNRKTSTLGLSDSLVKELIAFCDRNSNQVMELENRLLELTKKTGLEYYSTGRMVDDILEEVKSIMMLPFSSLCSIFPRMVRDISRNLGKQVSLEIKGEDVAVDRRILEQMKDPLIHLIRNSIDHGVESPDKRKALGKVENATIVLGASRVEGNKIEILVSDDGQGIDIDKVKKIAVQNRIISEKEAAALNPEDAARLIFQSGVSTSDMVTDLSGRGLGMAITRENIEILGGQFRLENVPGQGTAFKVLLPVTLATFKGTLVKVCNRFFILPNTHVIQVLKIPGKTVKTVENRKIIILDNRPVSFVRLGGILGLAPGKENDRKSLFLKVVRLGTGDNTAAFEVDDILGEQEVLVKGLGPQLRKLRHIQAVSIQADGSLVPVLNVQDILESCSFRARAAAADPESKPGSARKPACILVADDSLTSRVLIKNILEAGGFQVKTAVDGKDAFATLKTGSFDLVVSDVEMPEMDGFELTRAIRNDLALSSTPVVLVTSLESRKDREKGVDAGANAYIIKRSFDQNNLVEVIQRLV
ncbi:MAG: response regulator [Deltaproteobacteria bacterium]|nr:response regulator [Deltaproteobacteria bacterium]